MVQKLRKVRVSCHSFSMGSKCIQLYSSLAKNPKYSVRARLETCEPVSNHTMFLCLNTTAKNILVFAESNSKYLEDINNKIKNFNFDTYVQYSILSCFQIY